MTPQQVHYARIMIEGGCSIEDVAVTFGLRFLEAIHTVAPSLKANPAEQERVRRILQRMRLPPLPRDIPTIHIRRRSSDVPSTTSLKGRAAA